MNRRMFLREGLAAGAMVAGGGAVLLVRRNYLRSEMNEHLVNDALPPLLAASSRQIQALPVRAREEIRRFFHGKCLNVESFTSHVSTAGFREALGRCRSDDDRHNCLLAAFCARVATEAEILNQVDVIATEAGSELDGEWAEYTRDLSAKWLVRLPAQRNSLSCEALTSRVNGVIRTELEEAVRQSSSTGRSPALGQTIGGIGKSAIMLLPIIRYDQVGLLVGVPLFLVNAGREVWDYVLACITDRRGDFQAAISARIALLGNRVGAEFEREVRARLTDLHTWQERSVRDTANRIVDERVGFFI